MARNKGLHISKDRLHNIISNKGSILSTECINEAIAQYKYTIQVDNYEVPISVYFRSDKTITCVAQGGGKCGELSKEIVLYIKENADYNNVSSGTFTCKIDKEKFENLIKYLKKLEDVELILDEDKAQNGHITKFVSNIGDSITLTFWESSGTMLFQGYLMLLHVEVKSFISAYGYVKTELDKLGADQKSLKDQQVQEIINSLMPVSYNNLDPLLKDLIHDSIIQIVEKNELRDYAPWTFPVLKAIEGRTKQILFFNGIRINDKIGFKFDTVGNRKREDYKNIFAFNNARNKHNVDTSIIFITDGNTLNALEDCYNCLCKQRNTLFHVSFVFSTTRKVEKKEDAESIIYEACKIIEKSYKLIGR